MASKIRTILSKKMKIQYVSDLHLEFFGSSSKQYIKNIKNKGCDVCIVPGDIGYPHDDYYIDFLDHMSKTFDQTFIVPGNHEYYQSKKINKNMEEIDEYMDDLFDEYDNISLLNNKIEKYEGFNFIGTTMWSKITDPRWKINDVKYIKGLGITKYNELHHKSIDFLNKAIEMVDGKTIIITHHMPSYDLTNPKYKQSYAKYNQWFYADMNEFIGKYDSKINCWFYGHTHIPLVQKIGKIPTLCNPIGYPNENNSQNIDFNRLYTT
jgi:predicted phosphodiesterase